MTAKVMEKPLYIFDVTVVKPTPSFFGPPKPGKVHFSFYSSGDEEVQWSVTDPAGDTVYSHKEKAEKGINFFSWNTKDRMKSKKEKKKKRKGKGKKAKTGKPKAMKPKLQKLKQGDYTLIIARGKSTVKHSFKITR